MLVKGMVFAVSEGKSKKGAPCRFYKVAEKGARDLLTLYESADSAGNLPPPLCGEGEEVELEARTDFAFLVGRAQVSAPMSVQGLKKVAGL